MKYVELLREQYQNPATIHRIIIAIKHYYYYLNEIGERTDHPCRYLSINDREKSQIQLQDLLKESRTKTTASKKRKVRYPQNQKPGHYECCSSIRHYAYKRNLQPLHSMTSTWKKQP